MGPVGRGESDTELSRELGFVAVLTTATGTMIGAGIFILPGVAAAGAGPAAALSFLLAGLIAGIATFAAAELATAMPEAGGPYFFVSRAMGPLIGTIVGLGAWLALIFKGSFALVGLGQYAIGLSQYFIDTAPIPLLVIAVAAGFGLILINWMGAKASGVLQNVIVLGLLLILVVYVGRGVFAIEAERLTPFMEFGFSGVVATAGLVFISYLGIVKAAAISGEVRNPGRNLPLGLFSSVILVTVLYVAVMLIVTGTLPIEGIDARSAPVADAGQIYLGVMGAIIVAIAGILATLSTSNAAILASARFPFAMARDNLMSPWMSQISPRFNTPVNAIWVTGVTMLALAVIFDVESLAKLGGTFGILVFAMLNLAVLLLRRADPPWYDPPFKAPFYPFLPIVGIIAPLALIPQMGLLSQLGALIFIAGGILWYQWQQATGSQVQPTYTLADQLRRIQQQRSLDLKREALRSEQASETLGDQGQTSRVIVELEAGKPNRDLLTIAAGIADRHGAALDLVVVTEVPQQVPLVFAQRSLPPAWLRKVEDRLDAHGVEAEFHHIYGRDRDQAILGLIDEGTETVLVDWHEKLRVHRVRDSHVDTVLDEAPVRVGILNHRGISSLQDIVLASGGGPYERTELEMADAIASASGGEITFLKVLEPDPPDERRRNAQEYLDELETLASAPTQSRMVEGLDVAQALIDGSQDADLLIIGASREPRYRRTVFGRIADRVAAGADCSVLVTKDPDQPGPWRQLLRDRLFP